MDVPVTGTEGSPYPRPGSWQVSTGYRWQKSDRHYVGSEYQADRDADSSQVINRVNLLDLGVRYNWTRRTSLSVSLPYFIASRSNPIRDQNRVVFDRSVTHSNSISDSSFMARRWMNADSPFLGQILEIYAQALLAAGHLEWARARRVHVSRRPTPPAATTRRSP